MQNRIRKILLALTVLRTAACLSGCIRAEIDITVKKNGKADISLLMAADSSLAAFTEDDSFSLLSPEELENYTQEGFEIQEYVSGSYRSAWSAS